jgi:four helix bundle protein
MSSEGLERLVAWKKARDFAVLVYKQVIPMLPAEEKWSLCQQIRRSSLSIPANIAEGYGRFYYQEVIRFSYIARGSLEETLSHVLLAQNLGYLSADQCTEIIHQGDELVRILNGYINYLKKSKQGENEPGSSRSMHESMESYDPTWNGDEIDLAAI